ncbi:H-NS histone family protein [Aquabacterium sp. A7-Y]|uniref:H-NS family nucleoid-associated regulatory protein n=1 Tax=Aquabacterium sp. A7-Y TaxID=1349605 RepID=UPI00223CA092|nr:H-NS family nucleoid-associated regulatory protein [Aquabacterium sp. A7-Y]MCW7539719.1 H-NS histone family protein [Aquabacterium sp. A7-Y]
MTKSYSQLVQQIEALKQKANVLKRKEAQGVIAKIKEAIAYYDLTAEDLGFSSGVTRRTRPGEATGGGRKAAALPSANVKYGNEQGQIWSGRGPKPAWLREALAGGHSLEDYALAKPASPKAARRPAASGKTGRKVPIKYRDDAGNAWSGRGSKPKWLVAALKSGKTLEDFAVNG